MNLGSKSLGRVLRQLLPVILGRRGATRCSRWVCETPYYRLSGNFDLECKTLDESLARVLSLEAPDAALGLGQLPGWVNDRL